jgi:hypothetical protein
VLQSRTPPCQCRVLSPAHVLIMSHESPPPPMHELSWQHSRMTTSTSLSKLQTLEVYSIIYTRNLFGIPFRERSGKPLTNESWMKKNIGKSSWRESWDLCNFNELYFNFPIMKQRNQCIFPSSNKPFHVTCIGKIQVFSLDSHRKS